MISIILVSYVNNFDREHTLKMVLECLARQNVPTEPCEVRVILYKDKVGYFPDITKFFTDSELTFDLTPNSMVNVSEVTGPVLGDISGNKYCLSWLRNKGARLSTGDKLIFLDDNIVFGSDYIESLVTQFDPKMKFLMGWSRQALLTRLGRAIYKSEGFYSSEWTDPYIESYVLAAYDGVTCGPVIFNREFFFNVLGGYSENYLGEVGSDNDMFTRARFLVGDYPRFDYTTLHLWNLPRTIEVTPQLPYLLGQALRYPLELSTRMVHSDLGKEKQRSEIKYEVTLVGR